MNATPDIVTGSNAPRGESSIAPSTSSSYADSGTTGEGAVSMLLQVTEPIWRADQSGNTSAYVEKQLKDIVMRPTCRCALLELKGERAQQAVTIIQLWLYTYMPKDELRRRVISLLLKLSIASGTLPRNLFIHGVDIGDERDVWASGGFADVFRGQYRGIAVAVKRLRIPNEAKAKINPLLCINALLWHQLDHPYILPFLGVDADTFASGHLLCLVSHWMECGTLKEYLSSSWYSALKDRDRLLHEIAQGILYLHTQNIVHGDVNWVNVFVDDQISAKLADFGLAFITESITGGLTTASGPRGTVAWMSPERITPEGPAWKMSFPMDVYSFGILCHTAWTRIRPFSGWSDFVIVVKVIQGHRPHRPTPAECDGEVFPDSLWELVQSCLAQDPKERPTMSQIEAHFQPKDQGYSTTLTADKGMDELIATLVNDIGQYSV